MSYDLNDPEPGMAGGDLPMIDPASARDAWASLGTAVVDVSDMGAEQDLEAETVEAVGEVSAGRGGVVSGGKRTPFPAAPPMPTWPDQSYQDEFDGADGQIDYSDLAASNRDLMRQRVRLAKARRALREANRTSAEAKLKYGREMRRALIQQSGGSAESRRAAAEIACEAFENDMVVASAVAADAETYFRSVRDDIDAAKVVAYNLRAIQQLTS